MGTPFLYVVTILIWGTTWIAITYQLGSAAPTTSVALRFGLASVVLGLWCVVTRVSLRLTGRQHLRAAAQGVCLFGTNLWLLYLAERSIPSGVVSVLFTLLVPMNIVGGRLAYRTPIALGTVLGAVFGLVGVALVFWPQFGTVGSAGASLAGLAYAVLGTASASIGNLISVRNLRDGMPILQTNAFGMAYGALAMASVGLVTGQSFHVAWSPPYLLSLGYLAIFGSIFAVRPISV
jgi:drug/metabolite transporter (DMT)-like permease